MGTRLVASGLLALLGVGAHADVPLGGDEELLLHELADVMDSHAGFIAGRPRPPGSQWLRLVEFRSMAAGDGGFALCGVHLCRTQRTRGLRGVGRCMVRLLRWEKRSVDGLDRRKLKHRPASVSGL